MTIANLTELSGAAVGFFATLLVISYVIGDNPFFRFAIHVFVGISAGFAGAVALRNVILPQLVFPVFNLATGDVSTESLLVLVPLGLSVLLLAKLFKPVVSLGNIPMAYLVGVGTAVAIGGAVLGTIFPQMNASIDLLDLQTITVGRSSDRSIQIISRIVAVVGTLATLIYFHFGARSTHDSAPQRSVWIESVGQLGQVFIAITFGLLFAGVFAAAITALIERVNFLWTFLTSF